MPKPTKVVTGEKAKAKILEGVNAIYDPVKLTLGHKGGNALLYGVYGGNPRITNDGVTIAECIEPKDVIVQQVAQTFKEACSRTNKKAGDATTTTTVIAGVLVNSILNQETSMIGNNTSDVMKIRRELLEASKNVIEEIKKRSTKVKSLEDLEKIAVISMEDEELGKLIASIVWEVGVDGFVDVKEGFKGYIDHEIIRGLRFPAKVPHKGFVTHPARYEMQATDAPVLVTNFEMDNVGEMGTVVNSLFEKMSYRKLIILAPSFSDQVLIEFAKAAKNNYFIFPVKVPALRTEQFEDVCAYFDAQFIDKAKGKTLASVLPVDLGFVEKIVVKDIEAREDAIAIGGRGSEGDVVKKRIEELRAKIDETRVDSHKKLLERRIASLASAVAVLNVSSSSDAETKYLKLKIDDAVYACKGALAEGYVKGGGLCLKEIAESLPQNVLTPGLLAPYQQIKANAGVDELKVSKDVIDNTMATRLAVEHAVSVVAHLITTKIIVAEAPEDTPAEGYMAIASALQMANRMTAKREGLLKEGNAESEGAYDRMIDESRV